MKDTVVRRQYLKMHKNRIIKEYTKQKIEGIIPYQTCGKKGGHSHSHAEYQVYLRKDVIEDSFDTTAVDNFQLKIPKIDFDAQFGEANKDGEGDDLDDDELSDRCEKEDDFFHHLIIGHKSIFIQFWDILDTALSLFSGYMYAWIACFGIAEASPGLLYMSILFEVIFSFSIMFRFVTDYTPAGETQPEVNFTLIYTRYLKTGFPLDFIAWIPINFIYEIETKKTSLKIK